MGKALKKGPGARPAQPSLGLVLYSWGPSGVSLRLPVRLMEWMAGVGREADLARGQADRCSQNTSTATILAAERGGRFRAIPEGGGRRWSKSASGERGADLSWSTPRWVSLAPW